MAKPLGRILLSICIPTFNRAPVLDRLLANLSVKLAGLHGVEVCVSDNCSTDGTPQVIGKWKRTLPMVSRRNTANLGLDINFVKILEIARGEFVWYSGDDDVFLEGAIARLVEDIKKPEAGKCGAVYINSMSKLGPMADFDFEEFRAFQKDNRRYPPLNISFAGSLCLNRKVAGAVVKRKIRFENRKVVKKQGDHHVMDYFSPAYLFLECVRESGFFGIEPRCGIEIIADGSTVSYERKFYLDLILTTYPLEMKKAYPWFNDGARNYNLKSFIVGAAMAAHRPDLEEAYSVSKDCYLKLLDLEGHSAKASVLRAFGYVRRFFLVRYALIACFLLASRLLGLRIRNNGNILEQQRKNLSFAISRGRRMLA